MNECYWAKSFISSCNKHSAGFLARHWEKPSELNQGIYMFPPGGPWIGTSSGPLLMLSNYHIVISFRWVSAGAERSEAVSQTILLVISPGASKLVHGTEWVPSNNLWKKEGRERESKKSKHSVMRLLKIYKKHNRAAKLGLEG